MALGERQLEELVIPREKESIKEKIKLGRQFKIAASGLIGGMFLIQLLFASEYALLSAGGQNLITKQQELKEIQLKNQQLNGESKRLESLDRIEAIATLELGMTFPKDTANTFVPKDTFPNLEPKEIKEAISSPKKERNFLYSIKEIIKKTFESLA